MSHFSIEWVDSRSLPLNVKTMELLAPLDEQTMSLREALLQIGFKALEIEQLFSEKGLVGVFGVVLAAESTIYPNDRIELYTPILIDPKKARRKKANQNKDAKLKAKAKIKAQEKASREI